jgi:phosphatidate cytidylyltransferase
LIGAPLKSRIITSVVLASLVVAALLLLPVIWLNVVLALLLLVAGGWESTRLSGLNAPAAQIAWIVALCAAGAGLVWSVHDPANVPRLLGSAVAGWLALTCWLWVPAFGRGDGRRFQPVKLLIVGAILLAAFLSISWLHVHNPWSVIFLILLIAAADIGAYFTGQRFGGPKLAPAISPGKTWSGAAGGLIAAMATAAVASPVVPGIPFGPGIAAAGAAVLVGLSVCGDLVISLMKRHRELKDTSSLLPGHGGILDRADSLSAAAPAFALLVWWHAA